MPNNNEYLINSDEVKSSLEERENRLINISVALSLMAIAAAVALILVSTYQEKQTSVQTNYYVGKTLPV